MMVGAARRKARLPRKILRVILSDGSCALQPQVNGFKVKEEQFYDDQYDLKPYNSDHHPNSHNGDLNLFSGNHQYSNGHHTDYQEHSPRTYYDENRIYGMERTRPYPDERSYKGNKALKESPPPEIPKDILKEKSKVSSPSRPHKHQHPEPTPDFPYQCDTCDMLFKTIELLRDHQTSVHHNNRQFACRYCSKRFNDKYNMRKHVLIHVGEKRHKCQFCDKAFLRKDHLRSHLQTHYNRKFGCKICGKGFRTMELYQRHAKTHKDDSYMSMMNNLENLQPEVANVSQGSKKEQSSENSEPNDVNDMRDDDVPVTILDEDFNDSFTWSQSSPSVSETDMSTTNSPVPDDPTQTDRSPECNNDHPKPDMIGMSCRYCNVVFKDDHALGMHESNCSNETQKWQCMKCNIIFDEANTLKQHYEKVHSVDKPVQSSSRWRCKTCNINYPNSKELSRHYAQAHKDAQIFPCSECPKTFTVWHNLKKHMLIHLGDKKHKCNICRKGFVRKDHLNSHMKVHLGEGAKFTCPICNKVFRLKQMYFKHMNLHGLEQAYTVVDKEYR